MPISLRSKVSFLWSNSEFEILAIHLLTPRFLPIIQDRIFMCWVEVTAMRRSALLIPALSRVLIDVASPLIVETSKFFVAFYSL